MLSPTISPASAEGGVTGQFDKNQSPVPTCSDKLSPSHTLVHSSPELPPLPSFTYLQNYPRTPKTDSARRQSGPNQYYISSWGSPYSQPHPGSRDRSDGLYCDEASGSGEDLDSESPDLRFSLTHLLPSRNLDFPSLALKGYTASGPTSGSFEHNSYGFGARTTASRRGRLPDELRTLTSSKPSNTGRTSSWVECEAERQQALPPLEDLSRFTCSAEETGGTSSESTTPIKPQSRHTGVCNEGRRRWLDRRLGHKSRKDNLTLKPDSLLRMIEGNNRDIFGTMLRSKYADPAFEGKQQGPSEFQKSELEVEIGESSKTSTILESGLHRSSQGDTGSMHDRKATNVGEQVIPSSKRTRKKVSSPKGKTYVIHLPPLQDDRVRLRNQPLDAEAKFLDDKVAKRQHDGLQENERISRVPRDCEIYSQNREIFPGPEEYLEARAEKRYPVCIPDHSKWEQYVNELREQKLKALGVSFDDEKTATSMSRQSSSQTHISTRTPPLLAHFAGRQPSRSSMGHVGSPSLASSSPNLYANGSTTSPLPGFSNISSLPQGQRSVSPFSPSFGFSIPSRQSPTNFVWPSQPDGKQGSIVYNNSLVPAHNAINKAGVRPSIMPHEAAGLSKSQSDEALTFRRLQPQRQHTPNARPRSTLESVPENTTEDAVSPKTVAARPAAIVGPTPRGHRHNISASLEKDVLDAEYHLEKAIDRQLGEDGEFDSEPSRSQTTLGPNRSITAQLDKGIFKKEWPTVHKNANMQLEQLPDVVQPTKDTRSLDFTDTKPLPFIDENRRNSATRSENGLNKGQHEEAIMNVNRHPATGLPTVFQIKQNQIAIKEMGRTSEDNDSKNTTQMAHESKSPFSNLNAGAQEFSLHSKPPTDISSFPMTDFAFRQENVRSSTTTKQMSRNMPKKPTFNVAAPSFTPGTSASGSGFSTKDFNFLSGGPSFKPDAPEFIPQAFPRHTQSGVTEGEKSSISNNGSDRIFASFDYGVRNNARKTKAAVPIKSDIIPDTEIQAFQEDEDGRITRASDKQKKARRSTKDGDDVPRFALHPQRLSGIARYQSEKSAQADSVNRLENKENVAPQSFMDSERNALVAQGSSPLTSSPSVVRTKELPKDETEIGLKSNKESDPRLTHQGDVDSPVLSSHEDTGTASRGEIPKTGDKVLNTTALGGHSKADVITSVEPKSDSQSSLDKNDGFAYKIENASQQALDRDTTPQPVEAGAANGEIIPREPLVASQEPGIENVVPISQNTENAAVACLENENAALTDNANLQSSRHATQESHLCPLDRGSVSGKSDQDLVRSSKLSRSNTPTPTPEVHESILRTLNPKESTTKKLPSSVLEPEEALGQISLEHDTKTTDNIDDHRSDDKLLNVPEKSSVTGKDAFEHVAEGAKDVPESSKNTPKEHEECETQNSERVEDANKSSHIPAVEIRGRELDSDADDEDDELDASLNYRRRRPLQDFKSENMKSIIVEAIASQRDYFAATKPQQNLGIDAAKVMDLLDELKTDIKRLDLQGRMNSSTLSRSEAGSQDDWEKDSLTTAVNSVLLSVADLKAERDLNIQVSELKEQLKGANDARFHAERQLSETQKLLEAAEAESKLLRASPNNSVRSVTARDEVPCDACSVSSQSTISEQEDNNTPDEVRRLTAEVEALSSTLEEYRVSSTQWRSDIDQSHKDNEALKNTLSSLKLQLGDALRVRDAMQLKLEDLQGNLLKAVSQAANEKVYWQRMDQESRNKLELLSGKHDSIIKLKEKLEQRIGYLESEEREAVRLRIMYEQSQKANTSTNDINNYLRTENAKLEALVAHSESIAKEAKENGHAEAQRLKILLDAEVEVAKSQTDALRSESQSKISDLQSELQGLRESSEASRKRYEDQLQKQVDSEMIAVRDALQTKDAALKDNSRVHEENVANLQSHHDQVIRHLMEDKQQVEAHLNERLCLAREETDHLRDKIDYLNEKLEVSKSAAHAAATAAQSAKSSSSGEQPEKVSPKALRETIQALQEQLQEREQRIEYLESQVSSFDTDAPSKLKERETEVGWLRELFSVRVDDLNDLVNTLSRPDYDREIVRDAAIRIRASLQMEQQERERWMAGDRPFPSFPNVSTISNFASPKAAQLAAAIGNWRKGKETARLFQRPQSASSSESATPVRTSVQPQRFLSGLMTPPASNLRRTPDTQSSTPRRRTASRLSNATDLPRLEPRLYEKHSAPVTPPLLGQRSYDEDAESGQFSISRFQDDDTTSVLSACYDEGEREAFNRGLRRESEDMQIN